MNEQNFDPNEPVRFVVVLNRSLKNGDHYLAMKTSIEAADAREKEKVIDAVGRALKREISQSEDLDILLSQGAELVWQGFEKIFNGQDVYLFGENMAVASGHVSFSPGWNGDCFHIHIFTKADEKRAEAIMDFFQEPKEVRDDAACA